MRRSKNRLLAVGAALSLGLLQACSPDAGSPLDPTGASLVDGPPPPWSVTKTVTVTGGKSYDWEVTKAITPGSLVLDQGQSGTFNYTVTATRTEASSSVFTVSGQICVANNSGAPTVDLRIVDRLWYDFAIDPLVVVVVDVSGNPVLENGESHCYDYSYDMPAGFTPEATGGYKNKAYVNVNDATGKSIRVAEHSVDVTWPEGATDETATVVDYLECPTGFTCTPSGTSWVFTDSGSRQFSVQVTNVRAACGSEEYVKNKVILTESDSGDTDEDNASGLVSTQECAPPPSIHGCTPGYWKQKQHFDSWVGYTTNQDFDTVFGVDLFSPNRTLLQALSTGGGGANRLGRHATAALLNTSNGSLQYGLTTAQVIAAVQAAVASQDYDGASDLFEKLNERGCPLN